MVSVTFDHVTKRYRDVVAVKDLSLDVPDGEMLMLVGPSGCGKTTVLRLIAGLEVPDEGLIRFDGHDMSGVPPPERNIAMVFEGYALYPHMAVRDNLAFSLRLRKLPNEVVGRRVSEVAEAMELDHLLTRRPRGLATGEAQHVAVGRAVIREAPAVLLLDDALSHLDAQQRLEARAEVGRIHREIGSTVVSVTHDQAEALAVGTLLAIMDDGVLMQTGTPHELYEHPANVFVAGFLGSPPMNLVEMKLGQDDGQKVLRSGSLQLPAPHGFREGRSAITVGVRPEHLRLGVPPSGAEAGIRGRCDFVEYLGPQLQVHLRIGDDEVIVLDEPDDDIRAGDTVECSVPLDRLHLFDTMSGRALGRAPIGSANRAI